MPDRRALLVDDDDLFGLALSDMLARGGVELVVAASLAEARRHEPSSFDAIILDDRLPDGRGLELFPLAGARRVVVISAEPSVDMAIAALRHDAVDFLAKPIDPCQLCRLVGAMAPSGELGPDSRAMARIEPILRGFAGSDAPVLLRGETGTGKTRAARWLHEQGRRAAGPFVSVNCGALPESLIESELFGSERGAFTGAREARRGLIEAAHAGTFLLDEIGELPLACQTKLLDVLESKSLRRVGGVQQRTIDVRFVAATHVDLELEVQRGRFRRDLLYRLDVLSVELPPLREQLDALAGLIEALLGDLGCADPPRIADDELARLATHDWPGNVRELRNLLHRAMVLQAGGPIEPSRLLRRVTPGAVPPAVPPAPSCASPPDASLEQVALQHMLDVAIASPTRKQAAATLGIGESTLRRKLKQARRMGLTPRA